MNGFKRFLSFIVVTILIILIFNPVHALSPDKTVRVGVFEVPGLMNFNEDGSYSGYEYHYLQEVAKHTGFKYEYVEGSYSECLQRLKNGEIDIIGNIQYLEAKSALCDYTTFDIGRTYSDLVTASDNDTLFYDDVESFDKIKVGCLSGSEISITNLNNYCSLNKISVSIVYYDTHKEMSSALNAHEVDALVINGYFDYKNLKILARFNLTPIYFATTKGNQQILDSLNYALGRIKTDNPLFESELRKLYSLFTDNMFPLTKNEYNYLSKISSVRVVYLKNQQPISYVDKNGNFTGVFADVFSDISSSYGINFSYIPSDSFSGALSLIKSGNADIIVPILTNNEEWAIDNSISLSSSILFPILFGITKSSSSNALEEKNDITFAVLPEMLIDKGVFSQYPNYRAITYNTYQECFDAVLKGTADATLVNSYVGMKLLEDPVYRSLSYTNLGDLKQNVSLGVSKNADPLLFSIINKAIRNISYTKINEYISANSIVPAEYSLERWLRANSGFFMIIGFCLFFLVIVVLIITIISILKKQRYYDYDMITGLLSISKFKIEAKKLIDGKTPFAMIQVNLARFKYINETYGFKTGDEILRSFASIVTECLKESELATRQYSDRFVLLLRFNDRQELDRRFWYFKRKLTSLVLSICDFRIALCAGAVILSPDDTIDSAIEKSAHALSSIKTSFRSRIVYYNKKISDTYTTNKIMERDLSEALKDGKFIPYYQPKYNIHSGEIVGAEALIRWNHPKKGILEPRMFLPYMENSGFIIDVDYYMFEQTCRVLSENIKNGRYVVPIACNFSALHLDDRATPVRLKAIADRYNVPTSLLEIEMTESSALTCIQTAAAQVKEICSLGFRFSLDDFGSGYSSLSILEHIDADIIKLDRNFMNSENDHKKFRIAEAIVALADMLSMTVVCEGIETEDNIELMKKVGCSIAQGYYFSKPMPSEEFWDLCDKAKTAAGAIRD